MSWRRFALLALYAVGATTMVLELAPLIGWWLVPVGSGSASAAKSTRSSARSVPTTDARVPQQATACRGALDGFIAKMIEDHIREHVVDPDAPGSDPRKQAAGELIGLVHSYVN